MKRLWAAGILFLCAAALCFWQGWHTGRTTDLLEQEVRAAVEASEELGRTLSALPPLARYGTFDQLISECERALAQIDSLRWIDRPTPENIL